MLPPGLRADSSSCGLPGLTPAPHLVAALRQGPSPLGASGPLSCQHSWLLLPLKGFVKSNGTAFVLGTKRHKEARHCDGSHFTLNCRRHTLPSLLSKDLVWWSHFTWWAFLIQGHSVLRIQAKGARTTSKSAPHRSGLTSSAQQSCLLPQAAHLSCHVAEQWCHPAQSAAGTARLSRGSEATPPTVRMMVLVNPGLSPSGTQWLQVKQPKTSAAKRISRVLKAVSSLTPWGTGQT